LREHSENLVRGWIRHEESLATGAWKSGELEKSQQLKSAAEY